jgi:glycosyltransferase involved in cell wall biosynthesis
MPNKKTVFINQNAGYLMIDIINAHKKQYEQAVLIAGRVFMGGTGLDSYASIDKIIAYDKKTSLLRIATWLIATVQIFFKILFKYKNNDLFIVSNPPFSCLLMLFFKNKFSLLIYDTYPDVLIQHKVLRENSIIAKCWKKANKKIFGKAFKIYTISEGMANNLSQYIDRHRIKIIPNWSNTSLIKPIPKEGNPFIKEHGIENKFIILYSGNMGATHDVETIVNVANKLRHEKEISFLLIGEGVKKKKIKKMIDDLSLDNCLMLPFQKADLLSCSLSSADIGVVTLDEASSLLSVPSKTYNLMAAGTTLLCIGEKNSELNTLTEKYGTGKTISKKSEDEIVSFILEVKNNKQLHSFYCNNSLIASQFFTPKNAILYLE